MELVQSEAKTFDDDCIPFDEKGAGKSTFPEVQTDVSGAEVEALPAIVLSNYLRFSTIPILMFGCSVVTFFVAFG